MRAGNVETVTPGLEDERGCAAERIARRLCEGVDGLGQREGRAEHFRDAVEASLDLCLPLPLLEALCVVQRKRGQPGKGVEELEVGVVEVSRLAGAHSEDSPRLAEPGDRRVHDLGKGGVVGARRRGLRRAEIPLENRAARLGHLLEGPLGRDLPPNVSLRHADNRPAAQEPPVAVEDPAVRRVGSEELDHLVHESLDDRLEAQVAREHLRRLEERGLLGEAPLVLPQQLRHVHGETDLACDGFRKRDLSGAPSADFGPVKPEHADHPVEHQDRRGERGAGAEGDERVAVSEGGVVELRRRLHVCDGHCAPLPRRQIRHGEPLGRPPDRLDALCIPLGADGEDFP